MTAILTLHGGKVHETEVEQLRPVLVMHSFPQDPLWPGKLYRRRSFVKVTQVDRTRATYREEWDA